MLADTPPALPIANLAAGWSRATPRERRDLLALLFENMWIRRAHDKATKKPAKQPAAATRLTEELTVLIKQFVAKLPNATVHGVYKTLRASGKSVSVGRVRTIMAALHTKPKAARKPASK